MEDDYSVGFNLQETSHHLIEPFYTHCFASIGLSLLPAYVQCHKDGLNLIQSSWKVRQQLESHVLKIYIIKHLRLVFCFVFNIFLPFCYCFKSM